MLLAVAQPLSTRLFAWTGHGTPEVEQASVSEGPVTPAGEAFAIWAPLFAGSLAHAGTDLLSRHDDDPVATAAGWWVNAAPAGNVLWSLNAQFRRLDAISVALIGGSAASALTAVVRADRGPETPARRSIRRYIAPLAGWLSAAAFANVETALNRPRVPSRSGATARAVGLIAVAAAAAGAVTASLEDGRPYAAAAGWGFTGIALKAVRERSRAVAVAVAALLGVLRLVAAVRSR